LYIISASRTGILILMAKRLELHCIVLYLYLQDIGRPRTYLCSQEYYSGVDLVEPTEENLLICCPTVLGFGFGEKMWGRSACILRHHVRLIPCIAEFAVDGIREIE
jgi:hypothetical protein